MHSGCVGLYLAPLVIVRPVTVGAEIRGDTQLAAAADDRTTLVAMQTVCDLIVLQVVYMMESCSRR